MLDFLSKLFDVRITFWNRGAVECDGWSKDEAVGRVGKCTLWQTPGQRVRSTE